MKKALKIIAIIIASVFVVIQFIRPDFTNPPVNSAEVLQTPENVALILKRSCNDCHSNETIYPWYSRIQPAAWFLKDHIDEGRRELNFSVWATYSQGKKKRKFEEICELAKNKSMPLDSYLWIHRDAQMSDADIKTLCDWATDEAAKIAE
jgi:hypothetical protein